MIASRLPLSATIAAALFALAGCSQPAETGGNVAAAEPQPSVAAGNAVEVEAPAAAPVAPPVPTPSPSEAAEGETVGGDGSQIRLSPLTEKDIAGAALAGELACSFGQGRDTLLLAKGDVASKERAWGVIKVGGYVERVSAPGGFDGMLKGGTFAGKGTTLRLALTGPAAGGGESPPRPATLTYLRADGASRVFRGTWTCGP
ncbi:hypothetical protein RZN05_01275 [Sphingomonas sp. HF-S4]|uniref:Lipoprotein n=1 Tax=Sphingomonas agrestis TaxID=3080540 RepID=A0ABU3Y2J9_9SPHN|nr:hypothetical protein [Sphingomonas sp. HF-S4]MDV3455598.1 hypothetical protein [Sphingomonas sp. HF-S4]